MLRAAAAAVSRDDDGDAKFEVGRVTAAEEVGRVAEVVSAADGGTKDEMG